MDKRYNITITSTQDGLCNTWESEGELIKDNDIYVISYPDYAGNTHTDNRLEIGENSMRLVRSGAFTSDMIFEEYMMTQGTYDIMFRHLNIEVYTEKYAFHESDESIDIEVEYQIFDSGKELTANKMEISIGKNAC